MKTRCAPVCKPDKTPLWAKRPILYILVPFCFGIAFSYAAGMNVWTALSCGVIFTVASFLASRRRMASHIALYVALFFLGAAFYSNSTVLPKDHISNLAQDRAPQKVTVRGTVADDPYLGKAYFGGCKTVFLLRVDAVKFQDGWRGSRGLAEVHAFTDKPIGIRFGDGLVLEAVISKPKGLKNPGLFDYERYLAGKGVRSILKVKQSGVFKFAPPVPANPVKRIAYGVRSAIRSAIESNLDKPDEDFIKAMLIGDRAGLDVELNDEFVKTGTVHILSISGLHVGLIAGFLLACFKLIGLGRKAALISAVSFLAVYCYTAGASPPIIRSVLMFAVFAAGYIIERRPDLLNCLALAAFLMLLWNPRELFDPSFQLSFISIAGIFIFSPKIDRMMKVDGIGGGSVAGKLLRYLMKSVSVSVAAWIGTWPLIASYFNIISPVSIAANLVVIPLSFLSMMASALMLVCCGISTPLAGWLSAAVVFIDKAMFLANGCLSRLCIAYFRVGSPGAVYMTLYYSAILLWISPYGGIAMKCIKSNSSRALAVTLVGANIFVWGNVFRPVDGELKVAFLDVGQADCAVLEFPGGGNLLIDAGGGAQEGRFDAGRSVVAPYIWNEGFRRIDAILVTHPHSDHLGGVLYLIKNFKVSVVMDSGISDGSGLYAAYLQAVESRGIRRVVISPGDRISFGCGADLSVLSPAKPCDISDANTASVMAKLMYRGQSVLFCGDATDVTMRHAIDFCGDFLQSDIIKVPHHGGRAGDADAVEMFFAAVSPSVCVISAGRQDKFDWRQMAAIENANSLSYCTAENGAITAYLGSSGYRVKPFISNN